MYAIYQIASTTIILKIDIPIDQALKIDQYQFHWMTRDTAANVWDVSPV